MLGVQTGLISDVVPPAGRIRIRDGVQTEDFSNAILNCMFLNCELYAHYTTCSHGKEGKNDVPSSFKLFNK